MVSFSAAVLALTLAQIEPFPAPGFTVPVTGAWYTEVSSAMPLGALGTGFIDFAANATFGDATVENNWLNPKPVGEKSGFDIKIGDKQLELTHGSQVQLVPGSSPLPGASRPEPAPLRFWGHYPAADVDFGKTFGDVGLYLRAYAPLVPHDYDLSGMPAALFHFTIANHGKVPVPAEIALAWQPAVLSATTARGNVEGALGWPCEKLAPGAAWVVRPTIVFAESRDALPAELSASRVITAPLTGKKIDGGLAFDFGNVKDFFLDAAGGFDWEARRHESAMFDKAPHIGQIFWNLVYANPGSSPLPGASHPGSLPRLAPGRGKLPGNKAGRGPKGAYGLAKDVLPATTTDGALDIALRVCKAGPGSVVLEFTIKNVSDKEIGGLHFGLSLNADVGGPDHAENQRAAVNANRNAIVFEDPEIKTVVALTGDAARVQSSKFKVQSSSRTSQSPLTQNSESAENCFVGTWPNAHEAMVKDKWVSIHTKPPAPTIETVADGIQIKLPGQFDGSYALASTGSDGWAFQNVGIEEDVIRTRATKTLAPGETSEVVMVMTWYFPEWTSSDGEQLRHRYAGMFADAGKVAVAALKRADEIEKKIVKWQQKIYAAHVPPLLKDAVINSLYILPRNSWWIQDSRRPGKLPSLRGVPDEAIPATPHPTDEIASSGTPRNDGAERFFQSESFTGCPITETFVCRFNGSVPLALLFPDCERATMRSVAKAQAKSGEIPFGFGSPLGSKSPYYHVQHPIVSSEFVLLTWRDYALWRNPAYLDEMYPHAKKALKFAMTLDKDKDGLVNEDPGNDKGFPANQYYDIWPWWGTSAYTASIWLAALRAGEEMARKKGDVAFADELHDWYDRGRASFDAKLWTGAYYRLYNDPRRKRSSDTSLTNALCGQWFAYTCGLGEILPKEHVQSVIDTVLRLNAAATPYGAVNGVKPDGKVDQTFPDHSAVITIGEVWNFCAMAAFAGRTQDAIKLFNTSYENILLRQKTPWNIPWSLDRKTGAIKWGINYYSNPCVWTLFQALDPKTFSEVL